MGNEGTDPVLDASVCRAGDRPSVVGHRAPAGVEASARLTATTGIVLLALLAVEGATLLSIRRLVPVHLAVRLLLSRGCCSSSPARDGASPVTAWATPPPSGGGPSTIVLRMIGALLVLSTVVLLGTGS